MKNVSVVSEMAPSTQLHFYFLFYGDLLVCIDFLRSVNPCVVCDASWEGSLAFSAWVYFKDFLNITAFSSYRVRELISSFNPYLTLLRLAYSCRKCQRDLHRICLALPCGYRDQILAGLSACQRASFSLWGNT